MALAWYVKIIKKTKGKEEERNRRDDRCVDESHKEEQRVRQRERWGVVLNCEMM